MKRIDPHRRQAKGEIDLIRRFPTLSRIGVAAEFFPQYVHRDYWPHTLDVVLLTCIVKGEARHVMGDRVVEVGPGSVGITHYGQSHDLLTDEQGVDVINLYLDLQRHPLPVMPGKLQGVLAEMLAPHPGLVNAINRRVDFTFPDVARMAAPLELILREQREALEGQGWAMRHGLSLFLMECCRVLLASQWQTGRLAAQGCPAWMDRICQRMDEHYARSISLDELAQEAGVSREHLCRAFRHHIGRTPMAYLNDRRIQAAMWLLRTTDRKIVDVAYEAGFEDVSYFNRQFKAIAQITPGQYRQKYREMESSLQPAH